MRHLLGYIMNRGERHLVVQYRHPERQNQIIIQLLNHYFIRAKTPEELQRKMLAIQLRLNFKLTFYDIQKTGKEWIAWYEWKVKTGVASGE